jgi:hypothetical protein
MNEAATAAEIGVSLSTSRRSVEKLQSSLHLPEPLIEVIRWALHGESFERVGERSQIMRSKPHGHIQAVRAPMQRLGFESLIVSRRSAERDRVCAMAVARVLSPHTTLASRRSGY